MLSNPRASLATAVVTALLAVALVTGCGGCSSLLYHPTDTPPESLPGLASDGWGPASVSTGDNQTLRGLLAPPQDKTAPWILFFGGNAMSLASSASVLTRIRGAQDWGLAVFAYRGYDGSSGNPSEEALVADAQAVASFLERDRGVAADRLFVMGQSLGTGVAVQLAAAQGRAQRPVRGLVLLSPYASMTRVFGEYVSWLPTGWLSPDDFESQAHTDALPAPTLIIHGIQDTLIEIAHSRELAEAMPGRAQLVELPRIGHDVWADRRTFAEIRGLVSETGRVDAADRGDD